jgi:hypothetical protein
MKGTYPAHTNGGDMLLFFVTVQRRRDSRLVRQIQAVGVKSS